MYLDMWLQGDRNDTQCKNLESFELEGVIYFRAQQEVKRMRYIFQGNIWALYLNGAI